LIASTTLAVQSSKQLNLNTDQTLQPGRYVGGINISGGNITLSPGIYYMDHGGFAMSNGYVLGETTRRGRTWTKWWRWSLPWRGASFSRPSPRFVAGRAFAQP
jgi:hypothetical protein